jgi:hypothetical protein
MRKLANGSMIIILEKVNFNLVKGETGMSTFKRKTKHPQTGEWEQATWWDDYFGKHHYGVEFSDGQVFNPEKIDLETSPHD